MRGAVSSAMLLSALGSCASKPVPDLPREMTMDVNRPPFPIVNVISEGAATASSSTNAFREGRSGATALPKTWSGVGPYEGDAFAKDVADQHARLERLTSLRGSLR